MTGHRDEVHGCAVSADGTWVLTAGADGAARIWDVTHQQQRQAITGHYGVITAFAAAPDGTWLLSVGADGTARTWDVASGRQLRMMTERHTAVRHAPSHRTAHGH